MFLENENRKGIKYCRFVKLAWGSLLENFRSLGPGARGNR